MAYFNKIGLLIMSPDRTKFMVCEKDNFTSDFIMPGGQLDPGEDEISCLAREIREELSADVVIGSLSLIGEYNDAAAGDPSKDVSIRLYEGRLSGHPEPSSEIIAFHWLGRKDLDNSRVSPIIRNKIMPDIIKKGVLL